MLDLSDQDKVLRQLDRIASLSTAARALQTLEAVQVCKLQPYHRAADKQDMRITARGRGRVVVMEHDYLHRHHLCPAACGVTARIGKSLEVDILRKVHDVVYQGK